MALLTLWQARLLHYFPLGVAAGPASGGDADAAAGVSAGAAGVSAGAAGCATAAAASATEPPSQPDLSSWCVVGSNGHGYSSLTIHYLRITTYYYRCGWHNDHGSLTGLVAGLFIDSRTG